MSCDNEFFGWYRHPLWQKKRLEVMQRDGFRCVRCGTDSQLLHVHHNYYVKGRKPWEYPNYAYQTLCEDCHPKTANTQLVLRRIIGALRGGDMGATAAFASGIHMGRLTTRPGQGGAYGFEWLREVLPGLMDEENRLHKDDPFTHAFLAGLLWARQDGVLRGQVADLCRLNIAEDATGGGWLMCALEYLDPA